MNMKKRDQTSHFVPFSSEVTFLTHARTSTRTHKRIHPHIHTQTYARTQTHTRVRAHICTWHTFTYTWQHVLTHNFPPHTQRPTHKIHTYARTHPHTRTRARAHTHTHTHPHTPTGGGRVRVVQPVTANAGVATLQFPYFELIYYAINPKGLLWAVGYQLIQCSVVNTSSFLI